jgi:hypothetical protein
VSNSIGGRTVSGAREERKAEAVLAWRAPRTLVGVGEGVEVLGGDETRMGVLTSFRSRSLAPSALSETAVRAGTETSLSAD